MREGGWLKTSDEERGLVENVRIASYGGRGGTSVMSNVRERNKEGYIALQALCLLFCSEAYCTT